MSKIIVSILSRHTLPNFLLIKEFESMYDELLFITTPEAEDRSRQIEEALNLSAETAIHLSVDSDEYREILSKLESDWEVRDEDEYIVNLTGGTKMMSLAVHDFFAKFNSTAFYYVTRDNTLYNLVTGESQEIHYRASLEDYLRLYGLNFSSSLPSETGRTNAFDLYNQVKQRQFRLTREMKYAQDLESSQERAYYSGAWFEDYVYWRIRKQFNLTESHIAHSLKIYRATSGQSYDNEIDVAFMLNNALYVIECKVGMNGYNPAHSKRASADTIEGYLYKLAAVSKDLGFQVHPYLFTIHDISDSRESLDKRCQILGIKIIGRKELNEKEIRF